MSRIYFVSQDGEAQLSGSERAYAGSLCSDLFASALGLSRYMRPEEIAAYVRVLFPTEHYLHTMRHDTREAVESIRTALAVGPEHFTASLNTTLAMGSDAVKLLARLHGQCEIHAYVLGEDRAWLADIIKSGRTSGVLRADMGWESVAELLSAKSDGPVVTSYSVCDGFPNAGVAGWKDDRDGDGWYDLPDAEQWDRAWAALSQDNGLRLNPANWPDFYYRDGATAFSLLRTIREPELARG